MHEQNVRWSDNEEKVFLEVEESTQLENNDFVVPSGFVNFDEKESTKDDFFMSFIQDYQFSGSLLLLLLHNKNLFS
jgi:hypothetical protein